MQRLSILLFLSSFLWSGACCHSSVRTTIAPPFQKAIVTKEHIDEAIEFEKQLQNRYDAPAPSGQSWFEILKGESKVIVVAGHATSQIREGQRKPADGGTGSLAVMLNRLAKVPVIYTNYQSPSDPNFYDYNEFKTSLSQLILQYKPTIILDLHASHWFRPYDVDFGVIA